jgi:hypothetical protein
MRNLKFTWKQLHELQKQGKIRGYSGGIKKEPESPRPGGRIVQKHFPKKSEAKNFIALNLLYWCNERAVTLQEEYKFHPARKWRFDWYVDAYKFAVEFEGGIFAGGAGGHNSVTGIMRDVEKYNAAAAAGITVFRFHAENYKELLSILNNQNFKQ